MRLLRLRQAEPRDQRRCPVRVVHCDDRTLLVSTDDPIGGRASMQVATRVTVSGGKVTGMQQYL